MAEQRPYQQDAPDYSMSDSILNVDIRSLDSAYLSTCVRFAQSHGMFPKSHGGQHDTSLPYGDPGALLKPYYQQHSTTFGHPHVDPIRSDGNYPEPHIGNTFAGPDYAQHNHGNHSDP